MRLQQNSFAGGEFSPETRKRDDLAKYDVGVADLTNFMVNVSGSISNRTGLELINLAKFGDRAFWGIPFVFSVVQAYMLEFGDYYMRVFRNGGYVETFSGSGIPYEIAMPYSAAEVSQIKYTQSADTLYLTHPKHLPQVVTRTADNVWALNLFAFKNGPFMTTNTVSTSTITPSATTGPAITLTATASIFQLGHVGSLWKITHIVDGPAVSGSFAATGTSAAITTNNQWKLTTHGTWTGKIRIKVSYDAGVTWQIIRNYSSVADNNVIDSSTIDPDNIINGVLPQLVIECYSFTSGPCNYDLTGYAYEVDGIVKVTGYTSGTVVTGSVLQQLGKATATMYWSEGSWSDVRGYPSCVRFFDNRLVFACTANEPLTEWMSKPGDYYNHGTTVPSQDSDAISAPLISQSVNAIHSLVAMQDLLTFTSASEWKVNSGAAGGALTPTSIDAKPQSHWGSNNLDPLIIGIRVLFCQTMGSVIQDLSFQYLTSSWSGDDLTVLARHYFEGHQVVSWAYQQNPQSIIWAVLDNGTLLGLTYKKEHDIWAWHKHNTQGFFEWVNVIPGDGYDEVWCGVRRLVNGTTIKTVERLAERMPTTDPADQVFVDCATSYLGNPMPIINVSCTNPVVITCPGHGYSNGQSVGIDSIGWMPTYGDLLVPTEQQYLNWQQYTITAIDANTFSIPVDGTDFTSYIAGGYCRTPATVISGLGYLEGMTVSVLADGNVISPKPVVVGGQITLDRPACRVHVGLQYAANVQQLDAEYQTQGGSIDGLFRTISNIYINFVNSRGGFVGQSVDNLVELKPTALTTYNTPMPLFTGITNATPPDGYNYDGCVVYRQVDPLPVTITSIVREVDVGES